MREIINTVGFWILRLGLAGGAFYLFSHGNENGGGACIVMIILSFMYEGMVND